MIETGTGRLRRTHLGQECRIVRAFRREDGVQVYALKTAVDCLALNPSKSELIDLAEAHYLRLTEIAD